MYVYVAKETGTNRYKIGCTRKKPILRLKALNTGNSNVLELRTVFETKYGFKLEKSLHLKYKQNACAVNEWFEFDVFDEQEFLQYCLQENKLFEFMETENYFWQ